MLLLSPRHPLLPLLVGRPSERRRLPPSGEGVLKAVVAMGGAAPVEGEGRGSGVARDRDEPGLNTADVILQLLVLPDDVADGLPGHHGGDLLPPLRRVLVEQCEGVLEELVLGGGPPRAPALVEEPA